jgi:hypothetical protein
MKKIFTLLLAAAGTISFASAQPGNRNSTAFNDSRKMSDHRDDIYNKSNTVVYNDAFFSYKAKQDKIEMIKREYDQKITLVQHNWRLSGWQKAKQIQLLQNRRERELGMVNIQYGVNNHIAPGYTYYHGKW